MHRGVAVAGLVAAVVATGSVSAAGARSATRAHDGVSIQREPSGPAPAPSSTTTTAAPAAVTTFTTGPVPATTTVRPAPPAPTVTATTRPPTRTTAPAPVTTVAAPGAPSRPGAAFGVYVGSASPDAAAAFSAATGITTPYAMDFVDPTSWSTIADPAWALSAWQGTPYRMIWGVPMLPSGTTTTLAPPLAGTSLATEATGAYDASFTRLATELVSYGQAHAVIRIGWEFNWSGMSWAAATSGPAAFDGAFRHVVTAMRAAPGQHFSFEWNPTVGENDIADLAAYYPGNAYVDDIGMDVYDQAWSTYPGIATEWSTLETETDGLDWLAQFAAAQGKPIVLPEWGLGTWEPSAGAGADFTDTGTEVSGGDDAAFVDDMARWIASHDVVEATFWSALDVTAGTIPSSTRALEADFG